MKSYLLRPLLAGLLAVLLLVSCVGCGEKTEEPSSSPTTASQSAVATTPSQPEGSTTTGESGTTGVTTSGESTQGSAADGTTATTQKQGGGVTLVTKNNQKGTTRTTSKDTKITSPVSNIPTQNVPTGTLKVSDYVKNADSWTFAGFPNRGDFAMELQYIGYDPYNRVLVENTMKNLKLGDTIIDFAINVRTFEWTTNTVINDLHDIKPATREEALELVMGWYAEQTAGKQHPWGDMQSFTRWQHYAGAAGYDYLGCEIGASVNCYNLSVAFTRGAAKQYSKKNGDGNVTAWFVDFSQWAAGGMINYAEDLNPNMYKTQDGYHDDISSTSLSGQSPNATRRAYYMSYMAGCNWLVSEAGGETAYYPEVDANGNYKLSPHGYIFQDFYTFSQRNPDRGVCYTPFAVVLNQDHGLPYGHWMTKQTVFNVLLQTEGDEMIDNLIKLIYTDNDYPLRSKNQTKEQCTTPYGDTFDFLTQTANQEVLDSYPVLVLAGDIEFSAAEVARYEKYVSNGGILVMNTAYKPYFKSFDQSKNYGKGRVIVYGGDYDVSALDGILSQLAADLLPVQVSGNVQYLVNIKEGGIVVTLINNRGVSKEDREETEFDENYRETVTVTYTDGKEVLAIHDWMTTEVMDGSNTHTVTLNPGDITVFEFVV